MKQPEFNPKEEHKLVPKDEEVTIEKHYFVYVEDYSAKDNRRYRKQITHFITKGLDDVQRNTYVNEKCVECGKPNHAHGWIGNFYTGIKVCPGDYIISKGDVITKISPAAFEILFGNPDKVVIEKVDKVGQTALF